jgi:hypothetical protein
MKLYLLALVILLAATVGAQKCQQVGSSSLGKLATCKLMSPAPRLQWSINITLLQEYDWQAASDVQYAYMTLDDQPINETCYQGQTIKGKYPKGAILMVEHLCFGFKPSFPKGSKLYLLIFSSQESSASQVVYMTFNEMGEWESQ